MALQTTMYDIKNGHNFYFMAKLNIECAHSYDVQMWVHMTGPWVSSASKGIYTRRGEPARWDVVERTLSLGYK